MSTSVNLDSSFVSVAQEKSKIEGRSVPKQIEYWAKIGRLVEDNPDLPYSQIKLLLEAFSEVDAGSFEIYTRRSK